MPHAPVQTPWEVRPQSKTMLEFNQTAKAAPVNQTPWTQLFSQEQPALPTMPVGASAIGSPDPGHRYNGLRRGFPAHYHPPLFDILYQWSTTD